MSSVAGVVLLAGLLILPGLGALHLLAGRRSIEWWLIAPLTPTLSVGVVYATGSVCDLLGLGFTPETIGPLAAVLAGIGLIRARRRPHLPRIPRREILDAAGLVGAAIAGGTIWIVSRGSAAVLPNYDASSHGEYVRNIVAFHTLDPAVVAAPNPLLPQVHSSFYPLGLHAMCALAASLTGVSPATSLFETLVIFAVMCLPAGMYALTRSVAPDIRSAGLVAAAASLLLLQEPYRPFLWGGIPEIAGICAVPAVVALARHRLITDGRWLPALVAAAGSVAAIHSSEVVTVIILVGVLVVPHVRREVWSAMLRPRNVVPAVALLAALAGPQVLGLTSMVSSGGASAPFPRMTAESFVFDLLHLSFDGTPARALPAILLLAGLVMVLLTRRHADVAVAWLAFSFIAATTALPPLRPLIGLGLPWYEQVQRVGTTISVPLILLGALGLGWGFEAIRVVVAAGSVVKGRLVTVAAAGMGLLAASQAMNGTITYLRSSVAQGTKLTATAANWGRTIPGLSSSKITVLSTDDDSSMWLYDLAGVRTWGAYGTRTDPAEVAFVDERRYLATHIGDYPSDPLVDRIVAQWHIRYVFVNDDVLQPWQRGPATPPIDGSRLAANPHFEQVARSGQQELFEVLPPGELR